MHEAAFYGSDDELLALTVPFLEDGLSAGDPTLVAFADPNADLVRRALPRATGLRYLPGPDRFARPAVALARFRQLLADLVDEGAQRIRIVGEVPHPGTGVPWEAWRRYEAVANHAFRDYPMWGLCPYDTRTAPTDVLADAVRTHPFVATADGHHHVNDGYEEPDVLLGHSPVPPPDVLEARPPAVTLIEPTAAEARHAVADLALRSFLGAEDIENLVVGVSETVANAVLYGRPPVQVKMWAVPDRLLVTVTDQGPGPQDPFVGLLPGRSSEEGLGGLGLWITHQLCDQVTLVREADRFTVRLAASRR